MPYSDDFDSYDLHHLPRYFIDQSGVFEVSDRSDGSGQCLKQVVPMLINGVGQGVASDMTYDHGAAGFGCDWKAALFDDLSIRPVRE